MKSILIDNRYKLFVVNNIIYIDTYFKKMVVVNFDREVSVLLEKPEQRNVFDCKKAVPFFVDHVGLLRKVKKGW